jgi:hypothetical protein
VLCSDQAANEMKGEKSKDINNFAIISTVFPILGTVSGTKFIAENKLGTIYELMTTVTKNK